MLTLQDRLEAFVALGMRLQALSEDEIDEACWRAQSHNGWFTADSVQRSIQGLIQYLDPNALKQWIEGYRLPQTLDEPKTIGVIMAGNLPMVGVHDFICVLLSGNRLRAKLSSQDPYLLKELVAKELLAIEPRFADFIEFEDRMNGVDALIATGSDNSARYFEYYFKNIPHIIRKNRTGVAVLTGEESQEELEGLAEDVTAYFGLGCRNISKLYVKEDYNFQKMLGVLEPYAQKSMNDSHKYANNYDYNKSIFLVNREAHLDSGGLLVREHKELVSPIAVLNYETYSDLFSLEATLMGLEEKIQCVVGSEGTVGRAIPFGQAQKPHISDYADGVDTMAFLLGLPRQ